jgi:hypothetical protein
MHDDSTGLAQVNGFSILTVLVLLALPDKL